MSGGRILMMPALLLAALVPAGVSQVGDYGGFALADPVSVTVVGPARPVPAGATFDVRLDVEIEEPYHIYSDDSPGETITYTEVRGLDGGTHAFVGAGYPGEHHVLESAILGESWWVWEGAFGLRARFAVAEDAPAGPIDVTVELDYQACDDSGCLLPQYKTYELSVEVAAAEAGVAHVPAAGDEGRDPALLDDPDAGGDGHGGGAGGGAGGSRGGASAGQARSSQGGGVGEGSYDEQFQTALTEGDWWGFLLLAVSLALISLLTPCVFPMIPITVSFFAKRGEQAGGGSARYALAYGLGIVATYTGFGLLMALAFGAGSVQDFATNPWVNLAIGGLFVFFGLSLMGFYDLRPPKFLTRKAGALGGPVRPGYAPVMVMGFVFTITAFTCTAPIVGFLLPALSTSGSPGLVVAGMLTYSTVFALPFVLLALFPTMANSLPGAGGWMITVKALLGFVEVIAALKFFSNADLVWHLCLMPRPTMLLFAILIVAAMALYVFGTYRLPHDVGGKRSWIGRVPFGLLLVVTAGYLASGLTGRTLDPTIDSYLPPHEYCAGDGDGYADPVAWVRDHDEALELAAATDRNVFIDFTGITCVNCREVEKAVFGDPRFAEAMKDVVPTKLYTDRRDENRAADEINKRLMQERYGSVTLPQYIILSPEGEVLRQTGYDRRLLDVETFLRFVRGEDS